MTLVPRQVRNIIRTGTESFLSDPEALSSFRDAPAWVLLGEPGSGKTTAFELEADASGGKHLRISEFILGDIDEDWRGKTLFLDGLDEIRAGTEGPSPAQRIRQQLKRLDYPPFRIACRAADWYGESDSSTLQAASDNGLIYELQLEPLAEQDILTLLRDNHDVPDPQTFVARAENLGIAGLLKNPQTLQLLAESINTGQWPETRFDTYRLACEKLVEENSKAHRDQSRRHPIAVESLLDAAGQLCAVLLLSDKTGIALDPGKASPEFVNLNDCAPPDIETASQVIHRKLFRPEGIERVVPVHRSVAEYLAARWLARKIDGGLPLGRVLNLLLGHDGRTVAGLRGLYAWLAAHSPHGRSRLIQADPLTVTIYGDAKGMSTEHKRAILSGLRKEADHYFAFHWGTEGKQALGALADPRISGDFLAILRAPERDDATQSFVDCVLDILLEGAPLSDIAPALHDVIQDDSRWPVVRKDALRTWLGIGNQPAEALELLEAVANGTVTDPDDELTGALLNYLYPAHLSPDQLLKHLHTPKQANLGGQYYWFWTHTLPPCVPDAHLPDLLDGLVAHPAIRRQADHIRSLGEFANELLARGIDVHGDAISDQRLFAWLGMGADEYGDITRNTLAMQSIAAWLQSRPRRYKALLALCFDVCETHENPRYCLYQQKNRLHDAEAPEDIGLWHLERTDSTANEALARVHLEEAVSTLINQRCMAGLSLELLEQWANTHPEKKSWLEPLLAWEIPDWKRVQAANRKARQEKREITRRERTILLQKHLAQIANGTARVDLMHELACVWLDLYSDIHGETPASRFDAYCENGAEVLAATENGLRFCPERTDLPDESAIINLALEQREHFIRRPCLVGMDLRFRDGLDHIDTLPEDTLRRMLAFRLTYGADKTPDWFLHLVKQRPALVADVYTHYASTTLKSGADHIDSIHSLERDADYRQLAILAAPQILSAFPVRARTGQLNALEHLLKAALKYTPEALDELIARKLALKGMDAAQRVYWHAAATLHDANHEAEMWAYIGKSEARVSHLSNFLFDDFRHSDDIGYSLSPTGIGKLIERLMPHAEMGMASGTVTAAMRRGDHVRALINRLSTSTTTDARQELERLLAEPSLHKLKHLLEAARLGLEQRIRENQFRFPSPREVAQVLANQAPFNVADLAALALDHLDDIAVEIRQDNSDRIRAFWKDKQTPLEENYCRDELLPMLRPRLNRLGIDCQPEVDHANDKRSDIMLSYQAKFDLPIEIKRNSNNTLWTALRDQLIQKYSKNPRASKHGIYLILWFSGTGMPRPMDGGKPPQSPAELQTRLEAQLDPAERQRIFVRVLDVSWPKS